MGSGPAGELGRSPGLLLHCASPTIPARHYSPPSACSNTTVQSSRAAEQPEGGAAASGGSGGGGAHRRCTTLSACSGGLPQARRAPCGPPGCCRAPAGAAPSRMGRRDSRRAAATPSQSTLLNRWVVTAAAAGRGALPCARCRAMGALGLPPRRASLIQQIHGRGSASVVTVAGAPAQPPSASTMRTSAPSRGVGELIGALRGTSSIVSRHASHPDDATSARNVGERDNPTKPVAAELRRRPASTCGTSRLCSVLMVMEVQLPPPHDGR